MKAVIQRVSEASVSIENKTTSIGKGLLILLGVEENDQEEDITWLTKKVAQLRIFDDKNNIPNLSVNDINGEVLLISQFTLMASTKKGNRPSFILSLIHISEPTRPLYISYAVFCFCLLYTSDAADE